MLLTIGGDPHVTSKSLDRFQQLTEIIENLGNTTVWMGDLLDNKEVIRGKCLNAWFEYLKNSKLQHIILVGNHDWFNLECQDHSLKTLSSLPNVTIVDKLTQIFGLYFVPYEHKTDKLLKTLGQIPPNSVVFGHMDVKSFDYGNGYYSESGLDLSDLKKFKLVISGHYHAFQTKENLIYIGTPFSHSFGESNQLKVIGVFNTDTTELETIQTPIARHVTLELDLDEAPGLDEISTWMELNQGNFIRVVLWGPQAKIAAFPKHVYEKFNVRWIPKPDDIGNNNESVEEGIDNKTQFVKWAQDIKKLDKDTTQLGLSILEALNAK